MTDLLEQQKREKDERKKANEDERKLAEEQDKKDFLSQSEIFKRIPQARTSG